jgi:putative ABC transport system permease protein
MNLAIRDIRFSPFRFILTAIGIGLLLAATIGMNGLYRGIVFECLLIIDSMGADLWVVQGGRAGPFAELSAVPANLDRRVEGIPGVRAVRRFLQFNQEYDLSGKLVRLAITGLDHPKDNGGWIPLVAGRHLQSSHYEAIADVSTGLQLGEVVRLGHDDYTIVGLSKGQVDIEGYGMFFITILDAQQIYHLLPSEAVLLNRVASGHTRMGFGDNAGSVSAVVVEVNPYADLQGVKSFIKRWGDVEVFTAAEEKDKLLEGTLRKLRLQILAFTAMTLLVCCSVISLTIYTLTLEKLPQIGLLKLIGARDRVIVGLIVQEAFWIGAAGLAVAIGLSFFIYPRFPRTVLLLFSDVGAIGGLLLLLSLVASWFSIRRAYAVRAQEVLS